MQALARTGAFTKTGGVIFSGEQLQRLLLKLPAYSNAFRVYPRLLRSKHLLRAAMLCRGASIPSQTVLANLPLVMSGRLRGCGRSRSAGGGAGVQAVAMRLHGLAGNHRGYRVLEDKLLLVIAGLEDYGISVE